MIRDDKELQATINRIAYFQQMVQHLRRSEPNPQNYNAAAKESDEATVPSLRLRLAILEYS